MGVLFSCPFAEQEDVESALDSITVKSVNFNNKTLEPTILKGSGGKMVVEKSVSFKGMQLERMISLNRSLFKEDHTKENGLHELGNGISVLDPSNPKHEAAIKLQKVYKSFRTRRKLADCAVLVEQSWWKLLDFAELKRSSISFFEIEKHETAVCQRMKRHRSLLYNTGLKRLIRDIGMDTTCTFTTTSGFTVRVENLSSTGSLILARGKKLILWRSYLGPMERKAYEIVVEEGKFFYKNSGEMLQTSSMEESDSKWIFVLSTSKVLYIGKKKKGVFQHSSFLAGGATVAAGRLVVENGVLKAVWPHSGHYQPTEENFLDFLSFLGENNVDITDVKMSPTDEDEFSIYNQRSTHMRNHSLEEDLEAEKTVMADPREEESTTVMAVVETPKKMESLSTFDLEQESKPSEESTPRGGGEEEAKESEVVKIPEESILKRINSKKETRSFQLGKQLSCKWTTGAGPRIGCVRDYPSELQFQALEQVNLSPRSASVSRLYFSFSSQRQMPRMSPLWRGMSLPADITQL
uniref:Calmodulin-binding family protein n=1 Tax=Brassica oleracea TaxID=3712 RepID=A0A3P6AXK0_BRAOL|nr:unnamed protein product [Brassica oleracea]